MVCCTIYMFCMIGYTSLDLWMFNIVVVLAHLLNCINNLDCPEAFSFMLHAMFAAFVVCLGVSCIILFPPDEYSRAPKTHPKNSCFEEKRKIRLQRWPISMPNFSPVLKTTPLGAAMMSSQSRKKIHLTPSCPAIHPPIFASVAP